MQVEAYKHSNLSPAAVQSTATSKSAGTAEDFAVLLAASFLPVILCIRRLGIYADDWSMFARFVGHHDRTVRDYFRTYYSLPVTHSRPLMDFYEAVLFRCFGVHPLGYHIVNCLVFFASGVLFYLSLRLVLRDRFVALVFPVVFLLLPNYSSARFVPFTFMIGFSVLFLALNLFSVLKAAERSVLAWGWTFTSVAAVIISGLAYEIALPLFGLNSVVVWGVDRRKPIDERLRPRALALLLASNALVLLGILLFKKLTTTRYRGIASLPQIVTGAVGVHFYKLGLRLPIVAAKVILVYGNPALCVLAALFGVFVFFYLWRLRRDSEDAWTSFGNALRLVAFGIVVFALGLAMFLVSAGSFGFTATGVENRTATAASLGMAIILPSAAMCLGALVKVRRGFVQCLLIASLCAGELLLTGTIGSFWAAAADRQKSVLNSIAHDIPTLPPHSALLLDGVCPNIGPGIVFAGGGDMGGSLQLLYHDPSLRGDVVTPRLRVRLDGIETTIFGRVRSYAYGSYLQVYDFRSGKAYSLPDVTAAREHFGVTGPAQTFCPEGDESDGVPIF